MHRTAFVSTICMLLGGLSGCAARGNVELLESRLRVQEDRFVQLQQQLGKTEAELAASRSECDALRVQLARRGESTILPEQASAVFRATGIRFNDMLTGTIDHDGESGDEQLTALLTPHDQGGELVKLPGAIQLKLFDLSKPEGEQKLAAWEFADDETHELWHRGVLGGGYLIRLPLETAMSAHSQTPLLLHARLTTPDGREFVATTKINATPAAAGETVQTASASRPLRTPGIARISEQPPQQQQSSRRQSHQNPFEVGPEQPQPHEDATLLQSSDRWTEMTMPQYR